MGRMEASPAPRRQRSDDVTLKIPRPLYNKIGHIIEGTGFRSVTEFCLFVLRDLVSSQPGVEGEAQPDEIELIRRRLRSLGYLE
jgi:hypothetical protein